MVITNYGVSCFKIQSGNTVLAIDPYTKESGLTPPRFQADIVLVTQNHPLHANTSALPGAPFLITGAGEYEVKGIMIEGVSADERTVYVLEWENMRLCHLGAYSEKNIPDSVLERIGTPDILFLPVGSADALDAEEAVHVMNLIEPRIVIPMYYAFPGFTALPLLGAEKFLAEVGTSPTPEEKLTIKKKEVPQEETKIVLLHPVASKSL
ncbi:MAG: hypothetical protein G01um101429_595 [Parcubacteria group bacterium Gr01-1014_29]|nr:MAG: hypothetical protein G01um101429_595 [Parcubacteria group bacterium Gr01-1014_29]